MKLNNQGLLAVLLFASVFLGIENNAKAQTTDSTFVAALVYPNPFNNKLTILHNKSASNLVEVSIYDAIGNLVYSFPKAEFTDKVMVWNAFNFNGSTVNSGTYICYIRTRKKTESFVIQRQ